MVCNTNKGSVGLVTGKFSCDIETWRCGLLC